MRLEKKERKKKKKTKKDTDFVVGGTNSFSHSHICFKKKQILNTNTLIPWIGVCHREDPMKKIHVKAPLLQRERETAIETPYQKAQ